MEFCTFFDLDVRWATLDADTLLKLPSFPFPFPFPFPLLLSLCSSFSIYNFFYSYHFEIFFLFSCPPPPPPLFPSTRPLSHVHPAITCHNLLLLAVHTLPFLSLPLPFLLRFFSSPFHV